MRNTKRKCPDVSTPETQGSADRLFDATRYFIPHNGDNKQGAFDSFENTLILGGTGSGKHSSGGTSFVKTALRAGYGGYALCAKPEEEGFWTRALRELEEELVTSSSSVEGD